MANSRFALSNQNIVEQLKENAKNKNTLKATSSRGNGGMGPTLISVDTSYAKMTQDADHADQCII